MKRERPKDVVREYVKFSSIHGVPIIVNTAKHILERILWMVIVGAALGGAIALSVKNLQRYYATPTVVSLQKDFRNWNNALPAATGCFLEKADETYMEDYIQKRWNLNSTDDSYEYFADFVRAIANISYTSLGALVRFKDDPRLQSVDMMELAARVHPSLETGSLVTFDISRRPNWQLVLGEMGICFSVNTKFADYFGYDIADVIYPRADADKSIMQCHYLNGLCYARYDSDPLLPIKFHIHSYLDILQATYDATPLTVLSSQELEINYRMQETYASEALRRLSPTQRGCRFDDEPIDPEAMPMYSASICQMECRHRIILQRCDCKPFFYHKFGGRPCSIKELYTCVRKHASYLLSPPSSIGCTCPQPCDFITYLPQSLKTNVWEYGYFDQRITFRWGLLPPTTKYYRDVLFGFENLVVSIGGTTALFLGVSFISGIELYLFIFKLIVVTLNYHYANRKS